MMDEDNEFYEFLVMNDIATETELDLITNCYGYTTDTFERVLYARTGYETISQWLGIEDEE